MVIFAGFICNVFEQSRKSINEMRNMPSAKCVFNPFLFSFSFSSVIKNKSPEPDIMNYKTCPGLRKKGEKDKI